jgi:hypothetical protein
MHETMPDALNALNDEDVKRLQSLLKDAEEGGEECCVCLDTLKQPYFTDSSIVFNCLKFLSSLELLHHVRIFIVE